MNIVLPQSLGPLAPLLGEFFEAMAFKLAVNSHKDAIGEDDVDILIDRMMEELQEFKEQRLADATDPNMLAEMADTSNFAFLIYAFLRSRGVKDLKERFIDEFFEVLPEAGVVMCKKSRSGSPYKPGDVVFGSKRKNVAYIRAQHTISGVAVSVAIRDIVWWKHHGQWPERPLRYLSIRHVAGKTIDRIDNLQLVPEAKTDRYQFVFRYAPKGRENHQNFGMYGYQRRHLFSLVRVGYWPTEKEAAVEGLKAWKAKIREAV